MTIPQRLKPKIYSYFSKKSYALNKLDKKLEPYLEMKNKFFIEAGANDGISQSNTLYFEKYYNWKGLLVEPIPELAQKCMQNRPHCIVENCALVAPDHPRDTVEMVYCNLMSIVKGSMESEEEKQHIESGMQFLSDNEHAYTINVPARTLSDILNKHRIKNIYLLSLDVEGYEAQVLKGLDLDRYCPEFILVEVRQEEEIESTIKQWYELIAVLNINNSYSDKLYRRR